MDKELKILILEDNPLDAELMERELRRGGINFTARRTETRESFLKELYDFRPDLILSDYSLPNFDGLSALQIVKENFPEVPVIFVSGTIGEELAIETLKMGAMDFVIKNRLSKLVPTVKRTLVEMEDRAARKLAEQSLKEVNKTLQTLIEASPLAICALDIQGHIIMWNPAAEKLYGWTESEMLGQPFIGIPEDYQPLYQESIKRLFLGETVSDAELCPKRKDGSKICISLSMASLYDSNGTINGIMMIATDITKHKMAEKILLQVKDELERKVAERTVALQEANTSLTQWAKTLEQRNLENNQLIEMADLLQTCTKEEEAYKIVSKTAWKLFPADSGAIYVYSSSGKILESVAQWGENPPRELVFVPQDCWAIRRGQPHVVLDHRMGLVCGHVTESTAPYICMPMIAHGEMIGIFYLMVAMPIREEGNVGAMGTKQQLLLRISEHVGLTQMNLRLQQTLHELSIRDPLTNLFNRRYMAESLEREICRAQRKKTSIGFIMIDLDHFKQYNDKYGHAAGDIFLKELGNFLQQRIRGSDIACRYGGEEFLLILPEADLEATQGRAEKLREGVGDLHVRLGHQSLEKITISIGVAVYPLNGLVAEELLRAADIALYQAKQNGRNRVAVSEKV